MAAKMRFKGVVQEESAPAKQTSDEDSDEEDYEAQRRNQSAWCNDDTTPPEGSGEGLSTHLGKRISVYWRAEGDWFQGTVYKDRIVYDDDDQQFACMRVEGALEIYDEEEVEWEETKFKFIKGSAKDKAKAAKDAKKKESGGGKQQDSKQAKGGPTKKRKGNKHSDDDDDDDDDTPEDDPSGSGTNAGSGKILRLNVGGIPGGVASLQSPKSPGLSGGGKLGLKMAKYSGVAVAQGGGGGGGGGASQTDQQHGNGNFGASSAGAGKKRGHDDDEQQQQHGSGRNSGDEHQRHSSNKPSAPSEGGRGGKQSHGGGVQQSSKEAAPAAAAAAPPPSPL